MSKPRVVIIGGGFGGLAAARALSDSPVEIALVDKRNYHLFQPLLYQVATAALSPANIAAPIRRVLSRQQNCRVFMGEVSRVDAEKRLVYIGDECIVYDYLVIATGAVTNYFGNDRWERYAPGLKSIDEAIDVRRRFLLAFEQAEIEADEDARRSALTFAIVGAGPTGVELAGALAEISRSTLRTEFRHFDTHTARVVLIDAADRVLPSFDAKLSEHAHQVLERFGIEVKLKTRVVDVDAGGLTVEADSEQERINANNVIWAAGVRASDLGANSGFDVDRGGRIPVGDDLSVNGQPNVFAVGDVAACRDSATREAVPGVAQGAIQMGRFAGQTIAAEVAATVQGKGPPKRRAFRYLDKGSMAIIGKNQAVADVGGRHLSGRIAFMAWAFVHILFLIGFRRKLATFAEWTWMYFFHERGVRLITGEDSTPNVVKAPRDPRLTELFKEGDDKSAPRKETSRDVS